MPGKDVKGKRNTVKQTKSKSMAPVLVPKPVKPPPSPGGGAQKSKLQVLEGTPVGLALVAKPIPPPQPAPKVEPKKTVKKEEKEQPKTTIRKKGKRSNSMTSTEGKTNSASENDGKKGGNRSSPHTSSESPTKKSSEAKSRDSKEPSDPDSRKGHKFNKDLAQKFFKEMMESTRARKRTDDAKLETMPESSQINASMRALKKKKKKKDGASKMAMLSGPENLFKANGEPVWVVAERAPGEGEKDEDGVVVANPELVHALAEDDLEVEDKDWIVLSDAYMTNNIKKGKPLPDHYRFNPYATFEAIEKTNAYTTPEAVAYFTIRNLVELSDEALKRFARKADGVDDDRRGPPSREPAAAPNVNDAPPPKMTAVAEVKEQTKKIVNFNVTKNILMNYDRHNPIRSIQKLRCKRDRTTEQTAEQTVPK
ncbi:unnamed protein product [Caenorhabditis sp. 36 PRJEB53466]|nr:unnamed protein product [Caenorhabditis sp. 36 PRJEB53466]